MAHSTVMKLR